MTSPNHLLGMLLVFSVADARAQPTLPEPVASAAYPALLREIAGEQSRFVERCGVPCEPSPELIAEARTYVLQALTRRLFPAWYGTTWEFYGTTETPGQGAIACGYFVSTTLRDVGFRVPRIWLAQQASERIIQTLTSEDRIVRLSNAKMDVVRKHVESSGPGLYLVGLDFHVGFIVHDGQELRFVHSSYYRQPHAVISEPVDSENPLKDSRYRVIGKLLDDEMIRRWLQGRSFPGPR